MEGEMDIIIVCSTFESAKVMKNTLRSSGIDLSRVRFVSVRGLDSGAGLRGQVLIEPEAMVLAERLGLSYELRLWASRCRAMAS